MTSFQKQKAIHLTEQSYLQLPSSYSSHIDSDHHILPHLACYWKQRDRRVIRSRKMKLEQQAHHADKARKWKDGDGERGFFENREPRVRYVVEEGEGL